MEVLAKAKNYALNLIALRPRSEYEIRLKLKDKKYSEETITEIVEFLKEYDFLNDDKFSDLWIDTRTKLKPMGAWRIRQELKQKGIDDTIIENSLRDFNSEKELELALELATKKVSKSAIKRSKLEGFLVRRGFSSRIIREVLSNLPPKSFSD